MMRFRSIRWVAWTLTVLFAVPYLGSAAVAASPKDTLRQTAVLFPVDNMVLDSPDTAKAAKASEQLTALLQKGFAGYPKYFTMPYSDRLPFIQRIANTESDGKKLIAGPFSGDPDAMKRAVALAKSASVDVAIVGTLDFYKFDPAKGEASITATLQVVDVKTGKSSDTTVTGRAARGTDGSATESTLVADAVRDAGKKIMEQVTGGKYDATQQDQPTVIVPAEKKKSKKSWLPMLLLSLGVGLLLGGSGGSDGPGGGPEGPPDFPSF